MEGHEKLRTFEATVEVKDDGAPMGFVVQYLTVEATSYPDAYALAEKGLGEGDLLRGVTEVGPA